MTEYEIMYLLSEAYNQVWSIFQFWAGVSFAYLAVSYLAVRNFNVLIIVSLSAIYTAFSIHTALLLQSSHLLIDGYIADLQNMNAAGALKSNAGILYLTNLNPRGNVATVIALFGTFFAALLYLPYNYRKLKKEGERQDGAS